MERLHKETLTKTLELWFKSLWRCFFAPEQTGGPHKGPDGIESFKTIYNEAAAAGNLRFQKPIISKYGSERVGDSIPLPKESAKKHINSFAFAPEAGQSAINQFHSMFMKKYFYGLLAVTT
jgi:hypothetical protein